MVCMEEKQYPDATPSLNDTWARDKGTIYGEGDDAGKVMDLPTAHGMAALENVGHVDPDTKPHADEATHSFELNKEHEAFLGGLSEAQRENLEMMEVIKEKYPNAFTSVMDDKGREVMIVDAFSRSEFEMIPSGESPLGEICVITVDGVFSIDIDGDQERNDLLPKIDWTKFNDVIGGKDLGWIRSTGYGKNKEVNIPFDRLSMPGKSIESNAWGQSSLRVVEIDLQNDQNIDSFSRLLKYGEKVGGIRMEYQKENPNNGILKGKDIGERL